MTKQYVNTSDTTFRADSYNAHAMEFRTGESLTFVEMDNGNKEILISNETETTVNRGVRHGHNALENIKMRKATTGTIMINIPSRCRLDINHNGVESDLQEAKDMLAIETDENIKLELEEYIKSCNSSSVKIYGVFGEDGKRIFAGTKQECLAILTTMDVGMEAHLVFIDTRPGKYGVVYTDDVSYLVPIQTAKIAKRVLGSTGKLEFIVRNLLGDYTIVNITKASIAVLEVIKAKRQTNGNAVFMIPSYVTTYSPSELILNITELQTLINELPEGSCELPDLEAALAELTTEPAEDYVADCVVGSEVAVDWYLTYTNNK